MSTSNCIPTHLSGQLPGLGSSLLGSRGNGPTAAVVPPDDTPQENGGGAHTQQTFPLPRNPQATTPGKRTRANILFATLNMNGRASHTLGHSPISKWTTIHQTMRDKKIGILCLQETHLTEEYMTQINELFSRRLHILNSCDPERPASSAGIAFVINKEIITPQNPNLTELIPGRAASLTFNWHDDQNITILNIYAPNNLNTHQEFWNNISNLWREKSLPNIDFMMGDFNLTEDPLDRAPSRPDNEQATNALRNLRTTLNLQDSWRHAFPTDRLFTYYSNTNTFSRIDRIYTSPTHANSIVDWDAGPTSIPTDHKMILLRFAPPNTPYIGKGRWTWPINTLNNFDLLEKLQQIGTATQTRIQEQVVNNTHRTDDNNPQTIWESFKQQITNEAKQIAKHHKLKIVTRIQHLKEDLQETLTNIDENDDTRTNAAILESEINHLEKKKYKNNQLRAQAQWAQNGEKIGKYWTKINSPRKPRDSIHRLRNPTSNTLESRSDKMAEIARNYHENLQYDAIPEHIRETTRQEMIQKIPDEQKLTNRNTQLHDLVKETHIHNALYSSKTGTSTGLDGIPYETWKTLHESHLKKQQKKKPSFDVIKTYTWVVNDIQIHGISPNSDFSISWMCPLYKKKERTDIANYRPITLLNTDYKIFTKALATQLAHEVPPLIHPDQSGFIPKRPIFDPIRLSQMMIAYADITEEEGAIVALDQEKAYDKVNHEYLFATLETFNLPNTFINTVKALYKNAYTKVAINGILSTSYKVTRGVRQGDPLSCLLFDLAIEPLACSLRQSDTLQGYKIPGVKDRVIVNLYADDTTVYLGKNDRYHDLETALAKWCTASGAKFNTDKTEIIPIGPKKHRDIVAIQRKLHPDDSPLADNIKIAKDGSPIRSLGAWIGNEINNAATWETTLDQTRNTLNTWNRSHPTLDAKRLIVQMIAGGKTQFLTKAQGMPKNIEKALTKTIRDFVWDNARTPPISLEQLYHSKEKGGISLLDITARNQAIEITWLKSFLDLSPTRPTWAFIADVLINNLKPDGIKSTDDLNLFLHTWNPPTQGPRTRGLPQELLNMLKTAKKFNVSFAPIKMSRNLKSQLPAWFHLGTPPKTYHKNKNKCLREIHHAQRIKDLINISHRITNPTRTHPHSTRRNCACNMCQTDRNQGCDNPHKCATIANDILNKLHEKFNPLSSLNKDNLTLTHHRKEKNTQAIQHKRGEIIFDPTVTNKTSLSECFRIFTNPTLISKSEALRLERPTRGLNVLENQVTIYTDGSCTQNGKADAKCGSGIWISDNHPENRAIKIPGQAQSNQIGELAAILIALQKLEPFTPISFKTDSRYVIDGLTIHLATWEDQGWINIANSELFRATAYHLRRRSAQTSFEWIKGHTGIHGNEAADRLANEGANKDISDNIDLTIPNEFNLQGVKLSSVTQAIAYHGVRTITHLTPRRATTINLDMARYAVKDISNHLETDATIWRNCRRKELRRPIQQFLYKAIHGTFKIGEFWDRIPQHEHRAKCSLCHESTESMEHILTECPSPERTTIWTLAKDLWPESYGAWPNITIGTILGCGSIALPLPEVENRPEDQQKHMKATLKGTSRLLRILISESAHLIWVLRCARVIREETHTKPTIITRWMNKINGQLQLDRIIASKIDRTNKTIQTITNTWSNVITSQSPIPNNWVTTPEVLVGIKPPRSSMERGHQVVYRAPHTP